MTWKAIRIGFAALWLALASACSSPDAAPIPQLRPVAGGWISSGFGAREQHPIKGYVPGGHHDGYDFAVAAGSPVRATMAGTVRYAGWVAGYGNTVVLQHPNGFTTLYGHASSLQVKAGDRVKAGAAIALVGSTGLSTGPHLHYELRRNGTAIDPGSFVDESATGGATTIVPASYHVAVAAAHTARPAHGRARGSRPPHGHAPARHSPRHAHAAKATRPVKPHAPHAKP